MAITTKSALYDYILRQLGAPIVSVEITEDQVYDIISQTVQEFSAFALEGELLKYYKMNVQAPCVLTLDSSVNHILKVSKGGGITFGGYGGAGFVIDYYSLVSTGINLNDAVNSVISLSATRSLLDKYFGDDVSINWNPYKKKLEITEKYDGEIIIEVSQEYVPDAIDHIYDNNWVKRMCVARCK